MTNIRKFNFNAHKQRHIALKIVYFGWDYSGLAYQLGTDNTVESKLVDALKKTCLIDSFETCSLVRCGRTDKGVSSYGQIINLNVRSNLTDEFDPQNLGLFTPENYSPISDPKKCKIEVPNEINYVEILNRVLPLDIRVVGWAPVTRTFNSRFNCISRTYSYIFPHGDLNIEAMKKALEYLVGAHDFRNLCTFDLDNSVTQHVRTIYEAYITPVNPGTINYRLDEGYQFQRVTIIGKAFLYHQIRCIMSLIFLVGQGKEDPSLVKQLLDIKLCPAKPMYNHASPLPLSLVTCDFNNEDIPTGWICDSKTVNNIRKHLKKLWTEFKTKTTMIEDVLEDMDKDLDSGTWVDFGLEFDKRSNSKYTNIMKRQCHETLEKRLQTLAERQKT